MLLESARGSLEAGERSTGYAAKLEEIRTDFIAAGLIGEEGTAKVKIYNLLAKRANELWLAVTSASEVRPKRTWLDVLLQLMGVSSGAARTGSTNHKQFADALDAVETAAKPLNAAAGSAVKVGEKALASLIPGFAAILEGAKEAKECAEAVVKDVKERARRYDR